MIKLKDESISAYKGDYRPVELYKNAQKIHGFQTVGMEDTEQLFENTYNDAISVYGKSDYAEGVNLCPAPESQNGTFSEDEIVYNWEITAKENGYFDYSGSMAIGPRLARIKLAAGTYTASGCTYVALWWNARDDFLYFPATFTLTEETEVSVYFWHTNYTSITLEDQYIQIEKGETATEYSPYVGNSDFPASPYNLRKINSAAGNIRIEGANFLPPDFGAFSAWKLKTESVPKDGFVFDLDLLPGEYLLRFNIAKILSSGSYGYVYIQESTDGGKTYKTTHYLIQYINITESCVFTAKENCKYRFWAWSQMVDREDLFSDWSLQRTDIPEGDYMYFPTYNITCNQLEGIRVTENDAYNYYEEINGEKHYYISNILSGSSLKRNIAQAVFTGQEVFGQKEIESEDFCCYYCDLSHIIKTSRFSDRFLCNYFERLDSSETEKMGALLGLNDTNLYFFVEKTEFETLEDFVNWVASVYQKAKPLSLYYITDAQVVEDSGLEQSLCSYPMYTRIVVDNQGGPDLGFSHCIKVQNNSES